MKTLIRKYIGTVFGSNSLSLKWKIPLVAGLVVALAVLVSYFELRYWQNRQFVRLTSLEAEVVLALIRNSFEHEMERGLPHEADKLIASLARVESIHHIRVFDPSGTIWLSSRPEERGQKVSRAEMRSFRAREVLPMEVLEEHVNRQMTIVTQAIPMRSQCKFCHTLSGGKPGILQLSNAQAPFWSISEGGEQVEICGIMSFGVFPSGLAEARSLESGIIARDFILVTLIFAISLPLLLRHMVVRRIVNLADKMKVARQGNLITRASTSPADEIGDLGKSFNQLLESLVEARTEVEKAHREQLYHMERLSTVGELAVRVAHEIKNPIAGIRLGVDLLLKHPELPSEQLEATGQEIQHQIQRLDRVTRNLLNYSRTRPIEMAPCMLCEIVDHIRQFMETGNGEDHFRILVECTDEIPVLWADAKLLEQALMNLILNAKQANAKNVWIRGYLVSGSAFRTLVDHSSYLKGQTLSSRGHVIIVEDDGSGIPLSQLTDIWKPFYTSKREGTGLGLSIVRQIVQDHGGDVLVESVLGQGSTFTILLPAKENTLGDNRYETDHLSGG